MLFQQQHVPFRVEKEECERAWSMELSFFVQFKHDGVDTSAATTFVAYRYSFNRTYRSALKRRSVKRAWSMELSFFEQFKHDGHVFRVPLFL
jgi:hypothetical protein